MAKLGLAQDIINELKPQFNDFKRTIDRKYMIYEILRRSEKPYEIHKYIGSNQIIVKDNDKTIYDSDNETEEQKTNFEQWFKKLLFKWLIVNLPQ